jgi:exodeoxyribonuclease V beta subunit
MTPFDLLGELPIGTTVLEASAGTGKTYTIAALVARYVAEGVATLDEMLVITFSRMASQELRERVRSQLVAAERALGDPAGIPSGEAFLELLCDVGAAELHERRRRIAEALADFDAATIATTHQFCQRVLRSLGVAGDSDAGTTLVENLDELVVEVVDDLYLREYGGTAEPPPFDRAVALRLARAAVNDPQAALAPADTPAGSAATARVHFAELVRAEMDRRKRRLGILSYDDLLSRLATALDPADAPARERMRQRWRIVLVDEFQDTDPVQWNVLERAFHGHATLVLIGDPKQAIYAFRGGDIVTYLHARGTAETIHTLTTNWRSDAPLVDALQVLTRGAELGDPAITVHPVAARHAGSRLTGAPHPQPLRVRVVQAAGQSLTREDTVSIGVLRTRIAADLADDVAGLLVSGATYAGAPVGAGDVAILMSSLKHAHLFQQQLHDRGVASVVSGGSNVLATEAGDQWLALLEALEQPQRTGRIRSLGLTAFVGLSPADLDAGSDELTDELAERVRGWLDLFRSRGVAAVQESRVADGLAARVLARPQGERLLTDLDHLGQVLHEISHREGLGLVALLDWLRTERRVAERSKERTRRLETDARAVQLLTIHGSKGLQFPIVYLPLAFDCWPGNETEHLFHTPDGRRTLDVGGGDPPREAGEEKSGEELRLTYVALTRAQSQVVTWWGPSWYAGHAGTTRLLLGRDAGAAHVPLSTPRGPSDLKVMSQLQQWQAAGAVHVELAEPAATSVRLPVEPVGPLGVRRFRRQVDTAWRRTSYSGLIRADEPVVTALESEPEDAGTVDEQTDAEVDDALPTPPTSEVPCESPGADLPSPMEGLPAGATFGSLLHEVLEHADPFAPDLLAELEAKVVDAQQWWSVDATAQQLAEALLPMHRTSLGPLADGRSLADLGLHDRLCELDFEFPLTGGQTAEADVPLAAMAGVLRQHLDADDPMRGYADRLESPGLGDQLLRGYLSGSIDVVLRVGTPDEPRYVVVDYKTNRLGAPGEPLTAMDYTPSKLTEAMLHSHYPLQALLYSVVLHRYLRWRQPSYDPERHLGGVLYLYVRGMCGPETPQVDGHPCGVFSWHPPASMVVELSDLLAGQPVTGPGRGPAPDPTTGPTTRVAS